MNSMSSTFTKNPNMNTDAASRRKILSASSSFVEIEAYKTLRTNIQFSLRGKGCKKICITSSTSGEGKSITILNLAISFAEVGKKVLLIDADLRRPAIARLLREPAAIGLANVLADIVTPQEAIHKDVFPNLDIIFSGDIPPNPLELLNGEPMEKLISEMSEVYDYILVDTPPAAVVSDACVVANLLDGVLFLVRSGRSDKDDVKLALNNLQLIGAKIMGFILNGVVIDPNKKYYKYYDK